jgi:ABC-type Fe3+-hydroxamate transport system substrate-binding protein
MGKRAREHARRQEKREKLLENWSASIAMLRMAGRDVSQDQWLKATVTHGQRAANRDTMRRLLADYGLPNMMRNQ